MTLGVREQLESWVEKAILQEIGLEPGLEDGECLKFVCDRLLSARGQRLIRAAAESHTKRK